MPRIRLTLEATLKRADMSGRELERRTGVHRDTIGKYRHNTVRMVSLDILERFCAALGCHLADLLSDGHTPRTPATAATRAASQAHTPTPAPPTAQPRPATPTTRTASPEKREAYHAAPTPVRPLPATRETVLHYPDGTPSELSFGQMSRDDLEFWANMWLWAWKDVQQHSVNRQGSLRR